ncbi:putative AbiEii toxin of type IV toxin-antitoxin system [Kribbella voronezhensis]|uniref:Putative AbiEii toxin of type IV toxin-antitoxin system n=1 Tax=Kribbella voronezhensis TaxID=2512212 RepID=A0A4R7T6N8_9ACTN|nr:AAA family ATPase [Kribbella voronezhensis]TDU87560.1 putative AbiEii toxin of type IV toxin-antitoxin system [Kribbella voronezhensis]
MIDRIVIKGYRLFKDLDLQPHQGMNIIVGDNEAGKSTLMEAIAMALTGRISGRWAREELNPYWFNQDVVAEYFRSLATDQPLPLPEILIELYLTNDDDALQPLLGVHNSRQEAVPGVRIKITPSSDFAVECAEYLASEDRPDILPVEFYDVEWLDFSDGPLKRRPKDLGVSVIDSRTIRSTSGVDYHTREMLGDYVDAKERAAISVAHRNARHTITRTTLNTVNERIAAEAPGIHDRAIGLQMDQSSSASWESGIVPQVADVPFAMAGQGQQAAIKVALAMNRSATGTAFVLVEEPENHLSHTSLTKLVSRIETLAGSRQVFLTTHSSFVLNRLGLDKLILLHAGKTMQFAELSTGTVKYFKKLSGYDTLRLVLAEKIVLVEGPSDEMLFERAFQDKHGVPPIARGVDVISMGGVALARSLAVCAALDRRLAALRDNDNKAPSHWRDLYAQYLENGVRELFIGDPIDGRTLEPQLIKANGGEAHVRTLLNYTGDKTVPEYMTSNKTEAALRIAESKAQVNFPKYLLDAIDFVA